MLKCINYVYILNPIRPSAASHSTRLKRDWQNKTERDVNTKIEKC